MVKLTDAWYIDYRPRLLQRPFGPERNGHREVAFARNGSACSHEDRKYVENALKKLSPRHAASVRGHMQFYRACLETIGIVPPDPVVRSAVEIEWLWYSTPFKDFYRDHLAHVQKVTAIADFLVASRQSPLCRGSETALDWIANGMANQTVGHASLRYAARKCGVAEVDGNHDEQKRFWRCAIHTSLRYAGLLHDMAYPSVMVYKVRKAAEPNSPFPAFHVLHDGRFESSYQLFTRSLCGLPYEDIADESQKRAVVAHALDSEHNVQGAMRVLRYGVENNGAWRLSPFEAFCLEWASLAILMHDFDKPYGEVLKKLPSKSKTGTTGEPTESWYASLASSEKPGRCFRPRFQDDPVSYLLAFADQLQDFGRLNYRQDDPADEEQKMQTNEKKDAEVDDADKSIIFGTRPFSSVTLEVDKSRQARIDFEYSSQYYKRWMKKGLVDDRKHADAKKIFSDGWLDHEGLFSNVVTNVIQEP
jgi:hypothetical protein